MKKRSTLKAALFFALLFGYHLGQTQTFSGPLGIGGTPVGGLDITIGNAYGWNYLRGNANGSNPSASVYYGIMTGWNPSAGDGESQILYGTALGSVPRLDFGRWNGSAKTIDMTLVNGRAGFGITPNSVLHASTSGFYGDDGWIQIQRNYANESNTGFLVTPSGPLTSSNKVWALGFYSYNNDYHLWNYDGTNSNVVLTALSSNGYVGIGTANPHDMLSVNGSILGKKVRVSIKAEDWSDYVFSTKYKLRSLSSVKSFIAKYKHLPDVPTAKEVEKAGLDISKTQAVLLKKIEEITLYMLQQSEEIKQLKKQVSVLTINKK